MFDPTESYKHKLDQHTIDHFLVGKSHRSENEIFTSKEIKARIGSVEQSIYEGM